MIMYIINFVLCSGLLWAVYRLFLAGERMYRFNRFYLLFSALFALTVPLISIATKTNAVPAAYQEVFTRIASPQEITTPVVPQPAIDVTSKNYTSLLIIGAYVLVTVTLLVRFTVNLYRINHAAKRGTVVEHQHNRFILIEAEVTPHSFLNNIFINKYDYHDGLIEPEIICHEQAHVKQRHSLDVLLIELLQVCCWFNPFIFLYKRDIQLNHEFLADEAVVNNYQDTPAYQYLLLAKASAAGSLQLTSQFNYLTTKKRLMMMTKNTSAKRALAKQLALLPVLALAVFLFGQKVTAQSAPPPVVKNSIPAAKVNAPQSITDEYAAIITKYGKGTTPKGISYQKTNFSPDDKARLVALYHQMSKEQQAKQTIIFMKNAPPPPKKSPTDAQLNDWKNAKEYGVWIDDKKISNDELAKYQATDFDMYFISRLTKAALHHKEYHYQVDLMTRPAYADFHQKGIARMNDYSAWVRMPVKASK